MWIFFFPPSWFRIYQDAKMVLTKDITSPTPGKPVESGRRGDESKNLLDLSPSDIVFYVGGYPSNFTVSSKEIMTTMFSLCYPFYFSIIPLAVFLLLSRQILSTTQCTRAALSSPRLTTKSSVSIISKRRRRSIQRRHARGRHCYNWCWE